MVAPPAAAQIGGATNAQNYWGCTSYGDCFGVRQAVTVYLWDGPPRFVYDMLIEALPLEINVSQPTMLSLNDPANWNPGLSSEMFCCRGFLSPGRYLNAAPFYAQLVDNVLYSQALSALTTPYPSTMSLYVLRSNGITPPPGATDLRPYATTELVTLVATPEPTSIALLAGGILVLGVTTRATRRRRTDA